MGQKEGMKQEGVPRKVLRQLIELSGSVNEDKFILFWSDAGMKQYHVFHHTVKTVFGISTHV